MTELKPKNSTLTFGNIQIEKVTIQHSLHYSSHNGNQIIMPFTPIAVNPIQNVQTSVRPQSKQVMRSDTLSLTSFAYHEQLGKNCYRFQVNAESPQYLKKNIIQLNETNY